MWGKGDYLPPKYDDLKYFSRPYQLSLKIKIEHCTVGFDHCIILDNRG